MRCRILSCLLGVCLSAVASIARAESALRWHWEDAFTAAEQTLIEDWLQRVQQGVIRLVGPVPYQAHVHLHRRPSDRSPVPWAKTRKYGVPAVHFYVDPSHGAQALAADWTAAHELVHLLFPYLGEDSRWFAEGVASYLQYQVMYLNGKRSWTATVDKLGERFARGRGSRRGRGLSIPEHSRVLSRTRGHVRLYWGGAAYFLLADQALAEQTADRAQPLRLNDLIGRYVDCCWKLWGADAMAMIRAFDRLSETAVFRETFEATMMPERFPDTAAAERWLRLNPPRPAVIADQVRALPSAAAVQRSIQQRLIDAGP